MDGKRAVRATEVSQVEEGANPVSSTGQAIELRLNSQRNLRIAFA
ncbi:MAG: hypothetical protein ACJA2N_002142 [Salibacteraceae bacterium]